MLNKFLFIITLIAYFTKQLNAEETKTRIQYLYISAAHYLRPDNNFKNPRPQVEFKEDKVNHMTKYEFFENYPRKMDMERIKNFFSNHPYIDAVRFSDDIFLSTTVSSLPKYKLITKIREFFDDQHEHNKILFLTGVCDSKLNFVYDDERYGETASISYDEILHMWRSKPNPEYIRELLIILDCPNAGLWVNKCRDDYDYRDISIQASSTDTETAIDISGYGSLFLNNFLHAQMKYNRNFTDELTNNLFNPENELFKEKLEMKTEYNPITSSENILSLSVESNITKLIHTYDHKPSSCGMFYRNSKNFNLFSMFNSWDDIERDGFTKYERHHSDAKVNYVGEVKNGKPNGLGSLFYYSINGKYIGEFHQGEQQGRGMYIYNDTAVFEGYWKGNKKTKGVLFAPNGDWYAGLYDKETPNGQGSYYSKFKNELYVGEFKDGMQEGYGVTHFPSGGQYRGYHKNNEFNGLGSFWFNNTKYSESDHLNGKRHGQGWILLREGHNFTGTFVEGLGEGQGTMKYKSGDIYEGEFKKGKPNGKGKFTYINGFIFEGELVNGLRHGHGVLSMPNGDKYEGEFTNDKITGYGSLYYEKGIYKGYFKNGLYEGKGTLLLKSGGRFEGKFKEGKVIRDEDDL